ncbi:MAG TPA: sulfotransferase domain-containing protein [Candidatus Binataceae bacterium]|nr:sulfotransferase domain-containing protein [Candidatus Binataceae bacterium]
MLESTDPRPEMPRCTRVYQNWLIDSTRWNFLRYRDDDIIITTSYKAGTTWMQGIVANLIFGGEPPIPVGILSPFLEARATPLEIELTQLEGQTHRRFIKTHLPLDGFRFDPRLKLIYIGRDPRDVFMSMWNHHSNYTDQVLAVLANIPGRASDLPRPYADIHDFWSDWISKGSFPWETDGYPYWSHLHHAQSYWDYRHLPNFMFVHFNDLLSGLEPQMRQLAAFLEIEVADDLWPRLVRNCTFDEMKAKGVQYAPSMGIAWKGGAQTFFNKGTNGRWREVLTAEELAQYDRAAGLALTPECRKWLESGDRI